SAGDRGGRSAPRDRPRDRDVATLGPRQLPDPDWLRPRVSLPHADGRLVDHPRSACCCDGGPAGGTKGVAGAWSGQPALRVTVPGSKKKGFLHRVENDAASRTRKSLQPHVLK